MKVRLFLILVLTTGVVWLSAISWIFLSTRAEVERVLDARLLEAANMVSSLLVGQDVDASRVANLVTKRTQQHLSTYERQLSCQIWSLSGTLVGQSESAPNGELSANRTGFSETRIDGEMWRVYAVTNPALGVRVLVGDSLRVREGLVNDVVEGLLLPALLIIPVLALLIWLSVENGLAPIKNVVTALGIRSASDLTPLSSKGAASETALLIDALNGLFMRVADARDRERSFTAFAAHELRTPLAGLKTQAQVALASADPQNKERALGRIIQGVDRTSRLIRQLLDLASLESEGSIVRKSGVNPGKTLATLRDELLARHNRSACISVSGALFDIELVMDATLFTLAARNLLENALLHASPAGIVTCDLVVESNIVSVAINDSGAGIPEDELLRVTGRFFRGRSKTAAGSGLGLSIVELALSRTDAELALCNRVEGGLSARIVLSRQAMIGPV